MAIKEIRQRWRSLTGDMQDRVRVIGMSIQCLHSFDGWQNRSYTATREHNYLELKCLFLGNQNDWRPA